MKSFIMTLAGLGALAGLLFAADAPSPPDVRKLPLPARGIVDFRRDIQPIFQARCLRCHGPTREKGGLRLDDGVRTLAGGDSGPVIAPGNSASSRLIHLVAGLDPEVTMPPSGKRLTAAEIGRLRAWIDQGAKLPQDRTVAPRRPPRSKHWAYQPLGRPRPPRVRQTGWVRNPIDAFILARLEADKIDPSPEVDRIPLIRRLSLDLLGLPPTPAEVDCFLSDRRPGAYERLVDRLLASPAHGERWCRHWLDLARYADSDGFEKDNGRPFAWRYRHWVIAAFNRDLPFDEFTIEQLAGDLLPRATVEQKVATGFHRNTLTNTEGGVDQEQYRVEAVVDRVNTTAKVWLGATLACAQCHDHKYDPFSQREYYQLFAFFNSDREVNIAAPLPGAEEENRTALAAFNQKQSQLQAAVTAYILDQLPANQRKWEGGLKPADRQKLPPKIAAILAVPAGQRTGPQQKALTGYYSKLDQKLAGLRQALVLHEKTGVRGILAQTLALGPRRKTHVLIRGDFLRPGALVSPGTPAVLPPPPRTGNVTRLDLARWLVDPANPLTARVIMNWTWQHYFGRGLVATLEDFGTQGEKPSHPELLDWLAGEFIRRGWSMKAMHKAIVMSATYRQSSSARPELRHRDPNNILLARQNRLRLESEIIRDEALTASGLLAPRLGGPSVRPPQPSGISELTYAGSARWVESHGPGRYRRGMYTWFQRTSPYPMLMTFDSPDSNLCCARRDRTNTPLQALTLLNDTVFVECAQALARRAMLVDRSIPARINAIFRRCLGRPPAAEELSALSQLYNDLVRACRRHPETAAKLLGKADPAGTKSPEAAAWVALARAVMNLDEFVSRE
jgi:hypothetical protein